MSNTKMLKSAQLLNLANKLFNSINEEDQATILNKFAQPSGIQGVEDIIPTNFDAAIGDQGGITGSQLGSLALNAAKDHPFKTAGLLGTGAANIGGLMDNDKFGGQLAGLGLGGLGAYTLAKGNPYTAAMMTMGGGTLGALFDKLRAKKEQEQAQGIPNAGNPIAMMTR